MDNRLYILKRMRIDIESMLGDLVSAENHQNLQLTLVVLQYLNKEIDKLEKGEE